ncbi:TetR/AcrR family transcriptional regulator [Streptomyces sp. NPDC003247]|uniref:TetR/AcrR family transcriptional regulator n=1 Tax=Streptomyces sp. NPDC003247 TaxID=3364677 RepID=UPI0036AC7917
MLAAALEAFARTGYRGTSLEVVADAAGLTRAGLLHHFPSKRALLLAVLTERDEQDLRAFGRPLESLAGIEVLDFLDDLARLNTNRRGLVQLAHVLGAEAFDPGHPAHLYFRDRLRRIRTELTAALRRGVAAGTVREDVDCDRVVEQTIAVMEGLEALWLQDPDATDLAEAFRSYSEGLRRAMTRG